MDRDKEHPATAAGFASLAARATDPTAETRAAEDAEYDRMVGLGEYYRLLGKVRARFVAENQKIPKRAR